MRHPFLTWFLGLVFFSFFKCEIVPALAGEIAPRGSPDDWDRSLGYAIGNSDFGHVLQTNQHGTATNGFVEQGGLLVGSGGHCRGFFRFFLLVRQQHKRPYWIRSMRQYFWRLGFIFLRRLRGRDPSGFQTARGRVQQLWHTLRNYIWRPCLFFYLPWYRTLYCPHNFCLRGPPWEI